MNPKKISHLGAIAVCLTLASPVAASATIVNLANNNSAASVNLDSQAGMYSWTVSGQNQLNQQWFWYRVDGGDGLQHSIDSISASSIQYQDSSTVVADYANPQLTLSISYILQGGGGGNADILETIMVHNNSVNPMSFHLFQYSDFNLLGTPGGDQVALTGPGVGFDNAIQWKGSTQIAESITSPAANHGEAADVPSTLNKLNGTPNLQLSDADYFDGRPPGMNAAWALEWDVVVAGGSDFNVFKDKKLSIEPIPEPSVFALLGLSLGTCRLLRRRR